MLGRLESSKEFKAQDNQREIRKEIQVTSLKITVRDLNENDIASRKLKKNLSGAVILEISKNSPLAGNLNVGDIIVEIQKKPIFSSNQIDDIVKKILKKGEKNLLITVLNSANQRRYLGVKIN